MFNNSSLKFLEKLLLSSSVSGFEFETANIFASYLENFCDDISRDVMGNRDESWLTETIADLSGKENFIPGNYIGR